MADPIGPGTEENMVVFNDQPGSHARNDAYAMHSAHQLALQRHVASGHVANQINVNVFPLVYTGSGIIPRGVLGES